MVMRGGVVMEVMSSAVAGGECQGALRVAVLARHAQMLLAMVLMLATGLRRGDAPPRAA